MYVIKIEKQITPHDVKDCQNVFMKLNRVRFSYLLFDVFTYIVFCCYVLQEMRKQSSFLSKR